MEIKSTAVAGLLSVLVLFFFSGCSATKEGVKNERETGIKEQEFPKPALELIDQLWTEARSTSSYYKQYDAEQELYEIKFIAENGSWSLAFFPNGDPYDAEKLLAGSSEIPSEALKNMTTYLNKRFTKNWEMVRIQQRFVLIDPDDEPYELLEKIVYPDDDHDGYYDDDIAIQYEIEVAGSGADDFGTYELLFDDNGSLIESSKILNPAEDAMWY